MIGSSPWTRRALAAAGIFGLVFLTVPLLIVIPMSFSSARALTFPPPSLSLRWYETFFGDPRWMEAMWTSIVIAAISSVAALLLGGLAAYGLRRGTFGGRDWAEGNFMAPLVVPTIIAAIALYLGLAKIGLLGSFTGLLLAHTILHVPVVMMVLGVAVRDFDLRIEQVAWSLGASWSYTARRVLLPNLWPSVFAAWIFAFIGSFDEVIVTSFIAGRYETVPKRMFNELILEVNPTITAVATLLIAFTILALAAVALILRRAGKSTLVEGVTAG
ncbi:MAG: ABC transporter permease [Alphaproteobacteria bacterium]|nr:ABC transporter permease [Alphaproteobacteria bacterium]